MASISGSASKSSYDQYALGMRSLRATLSAFLPSRDAMAAISHHSPSCIPGRTLRTPIDAVLSTPHFTFLLATASLPGPPFRSITHPGVDKMYALHPDL